MAKGRLPLLETRGWLLVAAIPVFVLASRKLQLPALLVNALIAIDFVIAAPLVFITLRRDSARLRASLSVLRQNQKR